MSLTTQQVRDGLDGLGTPNVRATEDGRLAARCPACGIDGALIFSETPFGEAAIECEHDPLERLEGALREGIQRLAKFDDDPLAYVRDVLKEPDLQHVVKHGRGGVSYVLHYADGNIVELGNVTTLLSQPKFRAAYLPQRRRLPTKHTLKETQWSRLIEAVERAAEERDTVTGDTEEARNWISRYLRSNTQVALDTSDTEALYDYLTPDAGPFTDPAGRLHIRLGDFTAWVNQVGGGRVTSKELSARLSELGFEKVQPAARRPQHTQRDPSRPDTRKHRYYASTPDFDAHS